jgi:hypothetical protein
VKLLAPVIACGIATFVHHVHNAVFVRDYPNMPAWLGGAHVMAFWAAFTSIGVIGYLLHRRARVAGLLLLAVYAAYGIFSFAHYVVAPVAAHTAAMHVTIWAEMLAGLLLLGAVATSMQRKAP